MGGSKNFVLYVVISDVDEFRNWGDLKVGRWAWPTETCSSSTL